MTLKEVSFNDLWLNVWNRQRRLNEQALLTSKENSTRRQELMFVLEDDKEIFVNEILNMLKNKKTFQILEEWVKSLKENPEPQNLVKLELISMYLADAVEIRYNIWQDQQGLDSLSAENQKQILTKINMTPELNYLQTTINAFLKNKK